MSSDCTDDCRQQADGRMLKLNESSEVGREVSTKPTCTIQAEVHVEINLEQNCDQTLWEGLGSWK